MKPIILEPEVMNARETLAPGLTLAEEMQYEALSPFEVTNELVRFAESACRRQKDQGNQCVILNAGRGNPNFLNTLGRKAYAKLSYYAAELAEMRTEEPHIGFQPAKTGIAKRLDDLMKDDESPEVIFLQNAIAYAEGRFDFNADEFVFELVSAALGDFYPEPPRILRHVEKVVMAYLEEILFQAGRPKGRFDLFATEGATSAMNYTFKSLKENKILHKGDRVATVTPIFAPYLEIPELVDYELVNMLIEEKEEEGWQIPESEIEKLADPTIKVVYLVNPTNPTAVGLCPKTIDALANLVKTKRQDLIVVSDTVYATFVDSFYSLVSQIPENTICMYSYSKYFGVTGWRLGVIMLYENNVVDQLIRKLPENDRTELHERYSIVTPRPEEIKFIDRLEMDSRDVALAHTGGISGPQQAMMCLFSLLELIDEEDVYKKSIQEILDRRIALLYSAFPKDFTYPKGGNKTHYYALLNLKTLAKATYGEDFADYLVKNFLAIDFLAKLALDHAIISLPGEGFAGPAWALRVSLANLHDETYPKIGKAIMQVLNDYQTHYQQQQKH